MEGDAVQDRTHRVLTNAEVEIASAIVVAGEVAAVLNVGEGRFVEVGGAAEEVPYALRDRLFGLEADSRVARESLGVKTGGRYPIRRGVRRPASLSIPWPLADWPWRRFRIRYSIWLEIGAAIDALAKRRQRFVGHVKVRFERPSVEFLGEFDFLGAERLCREPPRCPADADCRNRCGCARESARGGPLGDSVFDRARSASRSLASRTACVCQPYASKRLLTSSEKEIAVCPSIVMWLSS